MTKRWKWIVSKEIKLALENLKNETSDFDEAVFLLNTENRYKIIHDYFIEHGKTRNGVEYRPIDLYLTGFLNGKIVVSAQDEIKYFVYFPDDSGQARYVSCTKQNIDEEQHFYKRQFTFEEIQKLEDVLGDDMYTKPIFGEYSCEGEQR